MLFSAEPSISHLRVKLARFGHLLRIIELESEVDFLALNPDLFSSRLLDVPVRQHSLLQVIVVLSIESITTTCGSKFGDSTVLRVPSEACHSGEAFACGIVS